MPTYRVPHDCPNEPDEPGDEVLIEEGETCPYCGWVAPEQIHRQITPHKGGRTRRLQVRLTPGAAEKLQAMAEQDGCSMSDVIERLIFGK